MSCLNQAYYRKPNGKMRTEEEVEEYMKSLPQIPLPPHNEEDKDIVEIINNNQVFLKYYKEQQEEIERLNNIINELEKDLKNEIKEYKEAGYDILEIRRANLWLTGCYDEDKEILNKIKELKEGK